MQENMLVDTVMEAGVDVLQVFISTSAILGVGFIWFNFTDKVFKTVLRLAAAPFSLPSEEEEDEEEEEE